MVKVIDYRIARGFSIERLTVFVLTAIEGGYQPIGGIAVDEQGYYQALVKYAPPKRKQRKGTWVTFTDTAPKPTKEKK